MVRKGHTKSRNGCHQCKTRHIKCGEEHPVCRKCSSAGRECRYPAVKHDPDATLEASLGPDITSPSSTDARSTAGESLRLTSQSQLHLKLFHNFLSSTCRTIVRTEAQTDVYRKTVLSRVFEVPYLMQAALGLSALHLSLEHIGQKRTYRHAATILQSQALETFDSSILQNVNADNVLELLLFQHLIALHVFCDSFGSIDDDFGEFLRQLVGCMRLLKGIDIVITPWWAVLVQTELGTIIEVSNAHQQSAHESRLECQPLHDMLDIADLSARSIQACRQAVDALQSYFDAENALENDTVESTTNMLFAWLITASADFTTLLEQRRPEALVVLAYYAVLLYRRRGSWAVAGSGLKLVEQIQTHLGNSWDEVLQWPQNTINGR